MTAHIAPPTLPRVDEWWDHAACQGADTDLWHPTSDDPDNHGRHAKAVCAACPVRAECLAHAIERREREGIWGGAAPRRRRLLARHYRSRTHEYQSGCACGWCAAVDNHFANIEGTGTRVDLNGQRARCGYRSTYARGCRCGPCMFAGSRDGQRFTAAGWRITSWWPAMFGDRTSTDLVPIAKGLARLELETIEVAAA